MRWGPAARRGTGSRRWVTAAVLLVAVAGAEQARGGPTDIAAVDEFIDAPRSVFGKTRAEVERSLGAPVAVHARSHAGSAGAGAVEELAYAGLIVRLHSTSALAGVVITSPGFRLPRGLGVDVLRSRVEATLGEPTRQTDPRAMYLSSDGYPDTVEFHFRDGAVSRIEWHYGSATPAARQ